MKIGRERERANRFETDDGLWEPFLKRIARMGCWEQKRKLTDMLGPPWSEDDLELFYQGFRKYGKNWKKVNLGFFLLLHYK